MEVEIYPLSDNVAHCPRNDDVIVLIMVKIEVFFHPRDEGIGDIRGVNL